MNLVTGWALAGGLVVWIGAVLWSGGFPKGLRPWLKQPKNASKALRWLTWVLAGAFAGIAWLAWASDPTSELGGFRTEATGIALAVIVIEEISRARAYLDYKQSVIQQMTSQSNDFALDATRIATDEGWLYDGSLQGAYLSGARLQGADLTMANLKGIRLAGARLQGAYMPQAELQGALLPLTNLRGTYLRKANLQRADLRRANLQGANLMSANLQDANLREAKLESALYNNETIWPDGFTPPADAINVDEMKK